jgi:hypothetical protein
VLFSADDRINVVAETPGFAMREVRESPDCDIGMCLYGEFGDIFEVSDFCAVNSDRPYCVGLIGTTRLGASER